jgi:hypothetical protein
LASAARGTRGKDRASQQSVLKSLPMQLFKIKVKAWFDFQLFKNNYIYLVVIAVNSI